MKEMIRVEEIDARSPYLSTVQTLWRVNAATLGFFTQGAFDDYASRKQILVALDEDNKCVGYCLYRISRGSANIVHLCVDKFYRGLNIASKLIRNLREVTKDLRGIGLRCRQDYEANKIWPSLNFVAVREETGRGKAGKKLTVWWLDHNHPNLFTDIDAEKPTNKLSVVLDANVFFDLIDPTRPYHEESNALMVDWLSDIELCLTEEILNEIIHNEREEERKKSRAAASQYRILPCDNNVLDEVSEKLKAAFEDAKAKNDAADFRQLARTIAADAKFFVTRDSNLLDIAEEVYQVFGITVIRPSDLIVRFDELRREDEYQPARLVGTLSKVRRVHSGEESQLTTRFLLASQGESKSDFQKDLRILLANPEKYSCNLSLDLNGNPMALAVYDTTHKDILGIPMLRVAKGPISNTLLRLLILRSVVESTRAKRTFTRITDSFLEESTKQALVEIGFIPASNEWIKVNPAVALPAMELAKYLAALDAPIEEQKRFLANLTGTLQEKEVVTQLQLMAEIERLLWPCKIVDAEIPSFIVPIRPEWAKELFDERLANQTLFGATQELAFNRESVYYKSTLNTGGLKAPGRILWYVSGKGRFEGRSHLRACSRLDEVVIGKPKELFSRFKRLGVYTWEHVFETAKRGVDNKIMAVRFSDTELLHNPIKHEQLQAVLRQEGIRTQLMSPVLISPRTFSQLYSIGNGLQTEEGKND